MQFRLDSGYFSNLKIRKLRHRLGDTAVLAHIQLFAYAAEHCPSGALSGMTEEDVEIAAGWSGQAGTFGSTLIELRLIDRSPDDQSLTLHDWSEHNQWVCGSPGRAENARFQNHKKWHEARGLLEPTCRYCAPGDAQSVTESSTEAIESSSDRDLSIDESSFRNDSKRNKTTNRKPLPKPDELQEKIAKVLRIFSSDRPQRDTITAAIAGEWLRLHDGDADHLVDLLSPHALRPIGYLRTVVRDPQNRRETLDRKSSGSKKRQRASIAAGKDSPSRISAEEFGHVTWRPPSAAKMPSSQPADATAQVGGHE